MHEQFPYAQSHPNPSAPGTFDASYQGPSYQGAPYQGAPHQGPSYQGLSHQGSRGHTPGPPAYSDPYPYLRPAPASPLGGYGSSPGGVVPWLVPIGVPWQAIVASYLALITLFAIPISLVVPHIGLLLGPATLVLGWWALARAGRQGSRGRLRAGFALVVGPLATLTSLAVLATLMS